MSIVRLNSKNSHQVLRALIHLTDAGDRRAVDQGRQAGGEDDAAELSSVPVQRSAAMVDCDCIRSGESLEAAVRSDAGSDRWAAASVGIAQAAAAPKKTIPISPRNGEVSEKAASGSRDDGLSGPCEDRSEPPERTTVLEGLSGRPMGVYSRVPEGQKTNSVLLPSSCRGSELANHYHL